MNWEQFLESLTDTETMSEEQRVQELGKFLAGIGVAGSEPTQVQTNKIVAGLERLALMVADQYGEQRWDEYSIVFSRMLAALSPTIKRNVLRYRTENKKLAGLFRNLIPTLTDEDLIDVISAKAKERSPDIENEVVDILKNVTGSRLPGLLSTLRVNVPELDFEKVASRLMGEMKVTRGEKEADAFLGKNLETQMRAVFPRLRDDSSEERSKAVDALIEFSTKILEAEKFELVKLLVDRLDTMADTETEISIFKKVLELTKNMYMRAQSLKKDDVVQFISRKFSKHLLRKDAALLERKKIVIRTINDIKDQNYVPELISLLWDPGTFADARDALASLSEFSTPLLLDTLRDTEDRAVRMKIIDVLVRIGHTAIPEIENFLSAREWYVRRNGVYILGEMEVAASIDKIGALITDDEEQVQLAVIESLIKIGGDKIKLYIEKGLNSQCKPVVLAAMRNLEKEIARKRLGDVLEWLRSHKGIPDEKHEAMRAEAAVVVGLLGDDSVVDRLVDVIHEKVFFRSKVLEPTKKAVLMALAQIGTRKAIQALRDASTHRDHFVSRTALDILRKVESNT
jgi:HEAT repeat protein